MTPHLSYSAALPAAHGTSGRLDFAWACARTIDLQRCSVLHGRHAQRVTCFVRHFASSGSRFGVLFQLQQVLLENVRF